VAVHVEDFVILACIVTSVQFSSVNVALYAL